MWWGEKARIINGVAVAMVHHDSQTEDEGEEKSSYYDV